MTIRYLRTALAIALCALAASTAAAAGQATVRVIGALNYLDQPIGIIEGSPGVFYSHGDSTNATVFSITTKGSIAILASFSTREGINGTLVSAANGRLYSGVNVSASSASLFSVSPAPHSKQVYQNLNLARVPTGNLPEGALLGVAIDFSSIWYLAKYDLKGNATTIYQFPSGERLGHTAIYASDGNYYGVSVGQNGTGYVYRVTPSGTLIKLVSFPSYTFPGTQNFVPLLQASDGNLYGTTPNGSASQTATFYKLTLGGQYTLLYTFPKGANYAPTSLIEGSDGNFYGATTTFYTQLIQMTKTGQRTLLYNMNPDIDGYGGVCPLTQGSDGIIYGTTGGGGYYGGGTIFALDAGLPKPAPRPRRFHPQSGPVGTKVLIWGDNLLSASVAFNGVTAPTVSNSGPNYVWATVPAGATTGPITVTTPGGMHTTRASFTVQ